MSDLSDAVRLLCEPIIDNERKGQAMNDNATGTLDQIRVLVHNLTHDHQEGEWQDVLNEWGRKTGRRAVMLDREPLLEQARKAIWGDTGRTHGGHQAPEERAGFNIQAFELYEDLTGRIASHYNHLTEKRHTGTPSETLDAWFLVVKDMLAKGRLTDANLSRLRGEVASWTDRIRSMFDPARVKDISGACPVETCNADVHPLANGSKTTALFAQFRHGEPPTVKCRTCGALWEGEQKLLEIAYFIGANVDEESLREMGVVA